MRSISKLCVELRDPSSMTKVDGIEEDPQLQLKTPTYAHTGARATAQMYAHPIVTNMHTCTSGTHRARILQNKEKLSVVGLSCLQGREVISLSACTTVFTLEGFYYY